MKTSEKAMKEMSEEDNFDPMRSKCPKKCTSEQYAKGTKQSVKHAN